MLGIHDYWLFLVSGIGLNLTPGQDTMYILGRTLTGGWRAGVASAFGITVGSVIHTLAAAAGLSVLLATFPLAFTGVKLCGAAYLVFLGAKLLFTPSTATGPDERAGLAHRGTRSAFTQGVFTNVLNPKVALFFLAFLPQFIDPTSSTKTLAFLLLGATFITTGTIWCLVLALAGARLRGFFIDNPNRRKLVSRATGGLFMVLGARLAWSR
jgi:threonine/homoserine/homoserine lactone efflux protein